MASPKVPVQMQAADWLELQGLLDRIEPGWQVLAFGSCARFQAKPHSDLDLAIAAPQALTLAHKPPITQFDPPAAHPLRHTAFPLWRVAR